MKRRIRKILIANRGEIALRIIRTARAMGIAAVAVYSEADAAAAHAEAADEAIPIGPAEAAKSYLNIAALIEAAEKSGADAIHPGYGFLSERAEFARACADAEIIFIGPSPDAMAALGDKIGARKIAVRCGVPIVAGIETADFAAVQKFAAKAGYPIVAKAAAGGGGRGMRVIADRAGLEAAIASAAHEATAAFGDGRLYIEKYLARPRHIEVQILGDEHGGIVALGERECSIQRRHQKIIEESPAPGLSEKLRAEMIDAAIRIARAAKYTGAGTIEFLLVDKEFYFLEANARIQVEHPITELRFGCDLVREQIRLAMGETAVEPDVPRGAAIECRINAEEPEHSFRPAVGTVLHLNVPGGPGVRFDSAIAPGTEITAHYDNLLGKLICWGADREDARARMAAALEEFSLLGVANNAAYLRDLVASEPFRKARLSTNFLEEFFAGWHPGAGEIKAALIAAALAADGAFGDARVATAPDVQRTVGAARSPWDELAGFELWRARR
ncbi:MAG: acetyl-CoA carboxylase biotin carboxylase subunit [Candidatus Binataceae bacterium]